MRLFSSSSVAVALLLCAGAALAAGTPVDLASKEQLEAAQKTYAVADDLFDAKRYKEAITAFRASHDIVASPNSRLMIARSYVELGRITEAWREYQAGLAEAAESATRKKKYAKTRDAIQAEIDDLEQKIARVTVSLENAPPGTKVSVGGVDIRDWTAPVVVAAGQVEIVATAPGGDERRNSVTTTAGQTENLTLTFEAPEAAEPVPPPVAEPEPAPPSAELTTSGIPLRTWGYVAGGVGIAGFATFGAFGALNNSKFDDVEKRCTNDVCPEDVRSDVDTGKRYQLLANIGLGIGVVGIGVGTALFVIGGKEKSTARQRRPTVSIGPGSVRVSGSF